MPIILPPVLLLAIPLSIALPYIIFIARRDSRNRRTPPNPVSSTAATDRGNPPRRTPSYDRDTRPLLDRSFSDSSWSTPPLSPDVEQDEGYAASCGAPSLSSEDERVSSAVVWQSRPKPRRRDAASHVRGSGESDESSSSEEVYVRFGRVDTKLREKVGLD